MKFFKLKTIGKFFLKITIGCLLFSLLVVSLFKWVDPPITSFMIQNKLEAFRKKEKITLRREWADLKNISPSMQIAVIAAEDQNFSDHHGFDFEAIEKAIKHNQRSQTYPWCEHDKSASSEKFISLARPKFYEKRP